MWFGEPHPFPERGSRTILSTSDNKVTKGDRVEHNFSCDVLTFTFVSAGVLETEVISKRVVWFFSSHKKTLQMKNVRYLKYSTLCDVLWAQISKGSMRRVELWKTKIEYSLMIGQQDDLLRPWWLNPGNVINYYDTD